MIRGKYLTSMEDTYEVMRLREQVFVKEQGFSADTERDACDDMAVYALVFDEAGCPSGTGRLAIDEADRFMLGRVCVLKERRGLGLGDLILRMLLFRAQELSAPAVYVEAVLPAVPFYERYGLRPIGDVCERAGAQYRLMRASADEIDIEGSCHKSPACAGCTGS